MALHRILQAENPDDNKILKTPCRPIKLPDKGLKRLIAEMIETMHNGNGVGLAAPQIGLSIRLTVIWIPPVVEEQEDGTQVETAPEEHYALINPRIVQASKEEVLRQEGCLSIPDWYGEVSRATWVTVEYQEPNGKRRRLRKADGLLGWVMQHEIDHLDGVLFPDRMAPSAKLRHISEIEQEEQERQEQERQEHEQAQQHEQHKHMEAMDQITTLA